MKHNLDQESLHFSPMDFESFEVADVFDQEPSNLRAIQIQNEKAEAARTARAARINALKRSKVNRNAAIFFETHKRALMKSPKF